VSILFHEAAFVSVAQSLQEPGECLDVNVHGTSVLLDAARAVGVHRVVLASSAAVYGDSAEVPHTETSAPATPSPYALSKRINEMFAQHFSEALGLQVVALRYFNVYGSRQREDSAYAAAVPIFIRRMLDGRAATVYGDGGQTRDLIHVSDVVRANLLAAEHPAAAGGIFNICTGVGTRITDVLASLAVLFPESRRPEFRPPRPGDVYHSVGSPARAADKLGFRAEVLLADGLLEAVDWARAT
jgi:UDP-glucose 4-epimerase